MSTNEIGKHGEDIAVNFLRKNRYLILGRNFFCRWGEIDIIALKDGEIRFVEVKYRKKEESVNMLELLTVGKINKIKKTALVWLQSKNKSVYSTKFGFDFVSVLENSPINEIVLYKDILSI